MQQERFRELEIQLTELMRGEQRAVPRVNGSAVVTPEGSSAGPAIAVVLSELRRDVPYDSCSVQELRGSRLVIVGGVGFKDLDVILGETFDIASSDMPNGEVVHRRRPVLVPDTEQYRAFRRGLHVGAGIRSWLGVPMMSGESLAGVLALDKAEPDFYTLDHADAVLDYARLVAQVLYGRSGGTSSPAQFAG